jgi:hypothetical protein
MENGDVVWKGLQMSEQAVFLTATSSPQKKLKLSLPEMIDDDDVIQWDWMRCQQHHSQWYWYFESRSILTLALVHDVNLLYATVIKYTMYYYYTFYRTATATITIHHSSSSCSCSDTWYIVIGNPSQSHLNLNLHIRAAIYWKDGGGVGPTIAVLSVHYPSCCSGLSVSMINRW